MIKTPTYHVFDLYKNHHDATLLGHWLKTGTSGNEKDKLPHLSATVSEKDGKITVTMTNLSASESAAVTCSIPGVDCLNIKGKILNGKINDKNTFEALDQVRIVPFEGIKGEKEAFDCTLPACSVAELVI